MYFERTDASHFSNTFEEENAVHEIGVAIVHSLLETRSCNMFQRGLTPIPAESREHSRRFVSVCETKIHFLRLTIDKQRRVCTKQMTSVPSPLATMVILFWVCHDISFIDGSGIVRGRLSTQFSGIKSAISSRKIIFNRINKPTYFSRVVVAK